MNLDIIAVRNGLYRLLTASGPYYPRQVSACSFDPLEGSTTCAVVFFPGPGSNNTPQSFDSSGGAARDAMGWNIVGAVYVKDDGDPELILARVWQAIQDIVTTVRKDTSLGGVAQDSQLTSVGVNIESEFEAAGATWQRINWTMRVDQY